MVIQRSLKSDDIEHYGVLLPLLVVGRGQNTGIIDGDKGIFSLITSEWKEMDKDRSIKTLKK